MTTQTVRGRHVTSDISLGLMVGQIAINFQMMNWLYCIKYEL